MTFETLLFDIYGSNLCCISPASHRGELASEVLVSGGQTGGLSPLISHSSHSPLHIWQIQHHRHSHCGKECCSASLYCILVPVHLYGHQAWYRYLPAENILVPATLSFSPLVSFSAWCFYCWQENSLTFISIRLLSTFMLYDWLYYKTKVQARCLLPGNKQPSNSRGAGFYGFKNTNKI